MNARDETSLRAFIESHHREVIDEFSAFARTLMPPGSSMTTRDLEDHCRELLVAIAGDLDSAQSEHEQGEKSMGRGTAHHMRDSGRLHADGRLRHGFGLLEVLAEFRALRASVLRLYERSGSADLPGVRRFNEAIDEALTESMVRYSAQTDLYRDQFIGILSHDLRNPLSAITAGAAFLARATTDQPRQAAAASRILSSAERMARMISDLLDFTRMRLGGTIPLRLGPANLQRVCEDVLLELQTSHPGSDVRFECRGDVSGTWDADRLSQVIANLVGNALDHGRNRPVSVAARGMEHEVVLTVHNEGVPIPAALLPRIFEPLVSGDSTAAGNVGLGLFIARAIATAHRGDIHVESSDATGTVFRLTLPRQPSDSV